MELNELINDIETVSSYIPEDIKSVSVLSLCHNSKYASPNCAFFCKKGALTDGHRYAYNAYANGARIFIAERALNLPADAAVIITPDSTAALNKIAVKFYGDPAKELKIIAVTGTKGKTTVALATYGIAVSAGINAGYIGTNGIYYGGHQFETANTTPDVLELQKAFREMRDAGVTVCMLEVSSQALWQNRTYGLNFEACVFTNLYRDHIGGCEHPTFEHYRDSKKKLFSDYISKSVIINCDSKDGAYITDGCRAQNIINTSACGNADADIFATDVVKMKNGNVPGVFFKLNMKADPISTVHDVFMPMPGHYSVENALLIISVCRSLGIDLNFVISELASVTIPGRFETVNLKTKKSSLFVIDYAHNGASLKAVIDALKEYEPERIICLFGSVGNRTFERRKELGEVARDNADVIIITSDNPNNEDPDNIIRDIRNAIGETDKTVLMISDRGEAVRKAYEIAKDGDFVLLCGKGHEAYQLINGSRIPFSERKVLELKDLDTQINYT